MILKVLKSIIGSKNERELKRMAPLVEATNRLESPFKALSDAELRAKTDEFRYRLSAGETLEDLLPEAFAAVREASVRTLGMRHFDVQLIGGIVLHEGKIAEMKTGEGKTLAATLPLYLNALTGKGAHLVTVNDYLARRDAEWMGGHLPIAGPVGGGHRPRDGRPAAQGSVRLRHHVRHQQRVRLRLPPGQHEVRPRGHGPAGASTTPSWTRWTAS